ncbi:MAG: metallophosphoesterase family protein [Isosphaeraceae bacterium]
MKCNRRLFTQSTSVFIAHSGLISLMADESQQIDKSKAMVQFGLITDLHHADKPAAGTRYYRETMNKFQEAAEKFKSHKPDFMVELGDLIDAADSVETELKYLKQINRELEKTCPKRYYVMGNHCVDTLKKQEFLGQVGQQKSYFSFDTAGWHFIILDACFRADETPYERKNFTWTDSNIPNHELDWLKNDLAATKSNAIVFLHQRLDESGNHMVRNAAAVRRILEESGKIRAVFQGHSHQNDIQQINNIPYLTMVAMIEGSGPENSGFSLVTIDQQNHIRVEGFRKQNDYRFHHKEKK